MLPHCAARPSLRRLGNNRQCGCATHTAKPKRDNFQINLWSSLFCFGSTSNTSFVIALALLVIPLGLEPKTYSLEGCCSIQLSYGTILRGKISLFFRLIKLFRPLYGQQCRQAPLSPNTTHCKSANYGNQHPYPIWPMVGHQRTIYSPNFAPNAVKNRLATTKNQKKLQKVLEETKKSLYLHPQNGHSTVEHF